MRTIRVYEKGDEVRLLGSTDVWIIDEDQVPEEKIVTLIHKEIPSCRVGVFAALLSLCTEPQAECGR